MACYSGLTRVIRHPRSVSIRAFAVQGAIRHVCRDAHAHARAHMLMQDARRHTPQQDARRHTPHSQLTRRTLALAAAGRAQAPGARDFCRVPMRHARGERRDAPLTTSYPLRGGRPFPAEPHCPSGSCAIFPARLLPASRVFIGQTFWCAARCDQWSDTFCERRE